MNVNFENELFHFKASHRVLFSSILAAFGDCRSTPLNAEFLGRYRVLFWTIGDILGMVPQNL